MDLNADGRLDILSGCYSARAQDMVAPVWVLYRNEGGDFAEAKALTNEEGAHIVLRDTERSTMTDRICTEPHATDWDGDGDLDLIIGNFAGSFLLAANEGTKEKPVFKGKPEFLKDAEGNRLKIQGIHGAPFVVDWDGDGDLDLLSGSSSGGVQISENTPGEDGAHRFAPFRALIEPVRQPAGSAGICAADSPVTPSGSTRIWVTDFNGDGKLDIVLGDCLRRSHPKGDLSVEDAAKKQAELNTKMSAIRKEMAELQVKQAAAADDAEAKSSIGEELQAKNKEWRAAYDSRSEFLNAVATGHVWVYLRK